MLFAAGMAVRGVRGWLDDLRREERERLQKLVADTVHDRAIVASTRREIRLHAIEQSLGEVRLALGLGPYVDPDRGPGGEGA
ncbi:MAG: hypothetical protein LCH53_05965 [Bacteroidetes bacterium]|nr:hypothetical protein [Bacteroidota bacterium]